MDNASKAHDNEGFQAIREAFEKAQIRITAELARVGLTPERPPGDTRLIESLGDSIDHYYGSGGTARQDALMLWNASSSLSHGERWFSQLYPRLASVLTDRSLDVVCSGFNLVNLHTLQELVDAKALVRYPEVIDIKAQTDSSTPG